MKVRIKEDVCQGHAMCLLACPEVFQLSDQDGHGYVITETVPTEFHETVELVVQSCPEQAIEIF